MNADGAEVLSRLTSPPAPGGAPTVRIAQVRCRLPGLNGMKWGPVQQPATRSQPARCPVGPRSASLTGHATPSEPHSVDLPATTAQRLLHPPPSNRPAGQPTTVQRIILDEPGATDSGYHKQTVPEASPRQRTAGLARSRQGWRGPQAVRSRRGKRGPCWHPPAAARRATLASCRLAMNRRSGGSAVRRGAATIAGRVTQEHGDGRRATRTASEVERASRATSRDHVGEREAWGSGSCPDPHCWRGAQQAAPTYDRGHDGPAAAPRRPHRQAYQHRPPRQSPHQRGPWTEERAPEASHVVARRASGQWGHTWERAEAEHRPPHQLRPRPRSPPWLV